MLAQMIYSGNGHTVYAICVSIEIALVTAACTVATREYIDAAPASSTVLDPVQNCFFDQQTRGFHRPPIIWRPPGTGVDGGNIVTVVERSSFVGIGNRPRKDSDPSNFRFVGNAYTADVVFNSRDFA